MIYLLPQSCCGDPIPVYVSLCESKRFRASMCALISLFIVLIYFIIFVRKFGVFIKYLYTRCTLLRTLDALKKFDGDNLRASREVGFSWVLDIKCKIVRHELIKQVLDMFDPCTCVFRCGGQE